MRARGVVARVCCVVAAGLFPYPSFSQNASVVDEQLVSRADVVVVGRVAEMRSEWNSDRTKIVTRVTLSVDEYLKGEQSQRSLVVSIPGGEIDGVGELYTHTPRFVRNEAVVLFAQREPSGLLRVVGGERGKIKISRDRLTGKQVVGENQLLEVFTSRVRSTVKLQQNQNSLSR
jgi:hypothetical protein